LCVFVIYLGLVWIQGCHSWRRRKSQQHPVWIHAWLRVSVEGKRKLSELFICAKMKRKLHGRVGVPSHPKQVTKLPLLLLESRETVPPAPPACMPHEIPDLARESFDSVWICERRVNAVGEVGGREAGYITAWSSFLHSQKTKETEPSESAL